jgi:hypothetical protein
MAAPGGSHGTEAALPGARSWLTLAGALKRCRNFLGERLKLASNLPKGVISAARPPDNRWALVDAMSVVLSGSCTRAREHDQQRTL